MVIRGGEVVSSEGAGRADVLIRGERIEAVGAVGHVADAEVVDAGGQLVIPGGVDVHTHFDMDAGAVRSADDFATGTIAAACGGTTTVVDFATAYRGETAAEGLAAWHAKAAGKAVVDYGFHMTLTDLRRPAGDVVAEMGEAGVTSFKLYMTYRDRLMVSDDTIAEIMRAAEPSGALVCLHCEDDNTLEDRRRRALAAGRTAPRWHAWSRPPAPRPRPSPGRCAWPRTPALPSTWCTSRAAPRSKRSGGRVSGGSPCSPRPVPNTSTCPPSATRKRRLQPPDTCALHPSETPITPRSYGRA